MTNVLDYKQKLNISLYVMYELLECALSRLMLPQKYYKKVQQLSNEISGVVYSCPKELKDKSVINEKFELTTFYLKNEEYMNGGK